MNNYQQLTYLSTSTSVPTREAAPNNNFNNQNSITPNSYITSANLVQRVAGGSHRQLPVDESKFNSSQQNNYLMNNSQNIQGQITKSNAVASSLSQQLNKSANINTSQGMLNNSSSEYNPLYPFGPTSIKTNNNISNNNTNYNFNMNPSYNGNSLYQSGNGSQSKGNQAQTLNSSYNSNNGGKNQQNRNLNNGSSNLNLSGTPKIQNNNMQQSSKRQQLSPSPSNMSSNTSLSPNRTNNNPNNQQQKVVGNTNNSPIKQQSSSKNLKTQQINQPINLFSNFKQTNNTKAQKGIGIRNCDINNSNKDQQGSINDSRVLSTNASSAKGSQDYYDPKIISYSSSQDVQQFQPIGCLNKANNDFKLQQQLEQNSMSQDQFSYPSQFNQSQQMNQQQMGYPSSQDFNVSLTQNYLSQQQQLFKQQLSSHSSSKLPTEPTQGQSQQQLQYLKSIYGMKSQYQPPKQSISSSNNLSGYLNKSQINSRNLSPQISGNQSSVQHSSLSPTNIHKKFGNSNNNNNSNNNTNLTQQYSKELFSKRLQQQQQKINTPQPQQQLSQQGKSDQSKQATKKSTELIPLSKQLQLSNTEYLQQEEKQYQQLKQNKITSSYQPIASITSTNQGAEYSQKNNYLNNDINHKEGVQESQKYQPSQRTKDSMNGLFLSMAKSNDFIQICQMLSIEGSIDINYKDLQTQNTALHYACMNGNLELVKLLLYHKAKYFENNLLRITPIMYANQYGHHDILSYIIHHNSQLNNNTQQDYSRANSNNTPNFQQQTQVIPSNFNSPQTVQSQKSQHNQHNNNNNNIYSVEISNVASKPFPQSNITPDKLITSTPPIDCIKQESQTPLTKVATDCGVETPNHKKDEMKNHPSTKNLTSEENKISSPLEVEKVGPSSFIVHGLIGKGSFGEVYLVEKKSNQMLYAMKVLHKSKIINQNLTKYAITERNVMSLTVHPFVVRLNFAFQTADKLFLIMDYCPGGDLGEHLQKEKKFSEETVKIYLAETVLALQDLHNRDIIFRDLKPDNIVLDYQGHIKLTDFGLSKEGVLDHSTGARSFCGSVAYLAPEMLKRCGHGKAVDWYLLGVVMYELLVGIPPYYASNRDELFENIEKAPLKIPSYLSTEARSLLKALLQRNPQKRLGSGQGDAEEIKAHPFFSDLDWVKVSQRQLNPPKPNRKIRISTKFDPNLFSDSGHHSDKDYIPGWSFAAS